MTERVAGPAATTWTAQPRTLVIGLGLIGGSLLRALAAAGTPACGYDSDPSTRAVARNATARQATRQRFQIAKVLPDALAGFRPELVVLAVPLPTVAGVLDELTRARYTGLLTDVTSVKAPVRELVTQRCPAASYIGGHPMAGREVSGFAASDPALFADAAWVLCLEPDTVLADWLLLAGLVTRLGARVVPVAAGEHDAVVARISHLPHLVASALAGAAANPQSATLAAGSFRDGTRVAASPPALVAAMCGGNAGPLRDALDDLLAILGGARGALDAADPIAALRDWLAPGHTARAAWPPATGDSYELPATAPALLELGRAGGWVTAVPPGRRTVTVTRPATG